MNFSKNVGVKNAGTTKCGTMVSQFPENGDCPVLDAMENAQFNIDEFPKKRRG